MTVADWATTISGFLAVAVFIGAAFRFLIKNYLSEMKPNSGSSMRDAIDGIRTDVGDIKVVVAKLEGKFEQHTQEHNR